MSVNETFGAECCWRKSREPHDTADCRYWSESKWLDRGRSCYGTSMKRSFHALILHGFGKIIGLFFG